MSSILEIKDLSVYYESESNRLFQKKKKVQILKEISFSIEEGSILGLVGESGCGKSTLAKAILGIHKDYQGEIIHYSQYPQMIFQDPFNSLNPVKKIGWILKEPLRLRGNFSSQDQEEKVFKMLEKVGLEEKIAERYPRELSGGQRQRVCIAAALMMEPRLLVADEPVSALDVTIQAQIIELLLKLQKEMGISILFISHDLRVVYQMCNQVMIMQEGRIVEKGEVEDIYFAPNHHYTKTLLEFC